MSPDSWRDRVRHMLEAIGEIRTFTHGMDRAAFKADVKTSRAVCMNFSIIGEAARHIPAHVRERTSSIPWTRVRGMRNFIVHVYHAIDEDVLWDTIQNDLPAFERELKALIDGEAGEL